MEYRGSRSSSNISSDRWIESDFAADRNYTCLQPSEWDERERRGSTRDRGNEAEEGKRGGSWKRRCGKERSEIRRKTRNAKEKIERASWQTLIRIWLPVQGATTKTNPPNKIESRQESVYLMKEKRGRISLSKIKRIDHVEKWSKRGWWGGWWGGGSKTAGRVGNK